MVTKVSNEMLASDAVITRSSSDPTASTNPSGGVGTVWLNTTSGEMFCLTDATAGSNVWTNVGEGTGAVAPLVAGTGGTITTDGDYKVHTFVSSGTFTASSPGNIEYLVIAGGGGGESGGGGAGGYLTATGFFITDQSYSVTVGAGGARDSAGANSIFSSITAIGGGQGGDYSDVGSTGGSGGGGGWQTSAVKAGGSATVSPSQGNAGGNSSGTGYANGGGGGGAGGMGIDGHSSNGLAGTGGVGLSSSITGSAVLRGGGGGGGVETSTTQPTASHGGGSGGQGTTGNNTAGTANTGGGGGGGGHSTHVGKAGGSGVVILRYKFQ